MASDLHCTHVEIDSCAVAFQTDCSDALTTFGSLLGELFSSPYYEYRLFDAANATRVPTFRYLDRNTYGVEFDAAETTCVLLAPWSEIRESSLLGMFVYALSEVVRQQRGEYLLHGSAVVRDGHAIVLCGPGQSGKTIMALHLCLEHGFALFANNKIKATSAAGELRLVRGDPVFNFRLNALRRYSESLAAQVFPDAGDRSQPWNVKRVISPDRLRIQTAPPGALLATFAFLQVNGEEAEASIDTLGHTVLGDSEFTARATLYEELSSLIRGSSFLPIVTPHGFRNFFIPCFDRPEFARRRTEFLETLFSRSRVVRIRGPLEKAATAVLEHHHAATCSRIADSLIGRGDTSQHAAPAATRRNEIASEIAQLR